MIDAVVNATITIYPRTGVTNADGRDDFSLVGTAYRCHAMRYSAREKSGFGQTMQEVPEGYAIVKEVLDVKPGARCIVDFDGYPSLTITGTITNVEPVSVLSVRLTQLDVKESVW